MTDKTLTFTPNYQHILDASLGVNARRFDRAERRRTDIILYGTMMLGGVLSAAIGIGANLINPAIRTIPVIIGAMALVVLFYVKVMLPWYRRRTVAAVNAQARPDAIVFSHDGEGLRWDDGGTDFRVRWGGVETVFATSDCLAFLAGSIAMVLPLASLGGLEEQRRFIAHCLTHMTPEAAERSRNDVTMAPFV